MVDARPSAVATPPRKRRFAVKLLRGALVLLLLLVALAWFAPAIVANTGLLKTVVARVGADLNGTVTADGASLGWFTPVTLRGVTVADADGKTVMTADTVSSSRTLWQLLTDRGDLGTFTVRAPKLGVVVSDGTTNVEKLIAKYLEDARPPKPDRTRVTVEVTGGTVVLHEPAANAAHTLSGLELSLVVPKSRAEAVTLSTSAESQDGPTAGKLGVRAEFLAGGKMTVTAEHFPVGNLAALVRRLDPTTSVVGGLDADVTATWRREENKPLTLTVDGTASAADVRLAGKWLGPDVVELKSVSVPCKLSYAGGVLAVEKSSLECDAGTVEFAGTLDPTADPESLAGQAGLTLKARVDVAKLAAVMPKLLRIKPGTEIKSGTVAVDIRSVAGQDGPAWTGTVATSKLEAVRDGAALVWESPLSAAFAGRLRPDRRPRFDKLEVRSDFLNVNARGEPEEFEAAARADLGTLAAKLGEFADLGGLKMAGDVTVQLTGTKQTAGGVSVKGTMLLKELAVEDGAALHLNEPKVLVDYSAAVAFQPKGGVRMDAAEVDITAGTGKLAVSLLTPVADLFAPATGAAVVTLVGDMNRWQSRLGALVGLPDDWTLGGTGTVTGTARFDADAYSVSKLNVDLTDAVVRIPRRLDLRESRLIAKSESVRYDRKSKAVAFTTSELSCVTVGATAPLVELTPLTGGGYGLTGTAALQTRLDSLQKALLLRSRDGSDALRGLAVGKVTLDAATADRLGFVADVTVTDFAVGPPANPTWAEPSVRLKADGALDVAADALTLKAARADRDGLSVQASGGIARLSSVAALDLTGTVTYDLQKLEPTLREYLGQTAQASGIGTKPFKLAGDLVGADLTKMAGSATVGWHGVKAYGFDVGPADLSATLKDGMVYMSAVEANFGGGKVKVTPGASLRGADPFLNFAPGKIIDRAKLTPAACADALGYALPAIANSAQADGTFSFDLDRSRIPFAAPTAGTLAGKLTVHEANVSPGPVIAEVLRIIGVKNTTVTLSRDNVVPIEVKDGRVHHRDFTMVVEGVTIRTAGSVGVDGTVKVDVVVPLGGKLAELIVPGNGPNIQRVRDAVGKQSVRIPVAGTLKRPTLDREAYRGQVTKLLRDASKEAAVGVGAGIADDLIRKGLDKFLPKK